MAKRNYQEMKLQFVVVKWLRTVLPRDAVFWHVPNGGEMTEDQRMTKYNLGEMPGVSDLMIQWGGKLHCIELKVRASEIYGVKTTTYQTAAQKDFQSAIEAAGGMYAVCRHTDDVRDALALWGVPTRESKRALSGSSVRGMAG